MESSEPNTIPSHPVNCEVTLKELQHIKMVRCNHHVLYNNNKDIKFFMKNDALVLFGVTRTTSTIINKCKKLFT